MSRLDSMLRRLSAQRDGLNWAAEQIRDVPGDVLELGLGNGRTYDHLREVLPDRRIWVVDRVLQCHPSCVPPDDDFLQGEAGAMLEELQSKGIRLALAHADLGSGHDADDIAQANALSPFLTNVMAPGGLILSDQPMIGFKPASGPDQIAAGRYFFFRAGENQGYSHE